MHILLTDILICPVCGPGNGLILLADRIEDRRVQSGALGCPNCRRQFPLAGGFAELRVDAPAPPTSSPPSSMKGDEERAVRLAALLGVTRGPGYVVIAGAEARLAARIAALIPDLEVIACSPDASTWPEAAGVNRLAADGRLPFFDGSLRGVALTAGAETIPVAEAARVLAPGCRLVLKHGDDGAADMLAAAGLRLLARQADTILAARG